MFETGFFTHVSAEKSGKGRAYLARLDRGPRGRVERAFAKGASQNARRAFSLPVRPGDVFEARFWQWQRSDGGGYTGGTYWYTVSPTGGIVMLTRDEAISAVWSLQIVSHQTTTFPALPAAPCGRMVPNGLLCWSATLPAARPKIGRNLRPRPVPLVIDHDD